MSVITNQVVDPQDDYTKALEQLKQQQLAYQTLLGDFKKELQKIIELWKSGKTGAAYQMMQNQLLPNFMEQKSSQVGEAAATMNIGSSLQKFISSIQYDINQMQAISKKYPDPKDKDKAVAEMKPYATDLVAKFKQFSGDINAKNLPWLSPTTLTNLNEGIGNFCQIFSGTNDPNNLNVNTLSVFMWRMTNYPNLSGNPMDPYFPNLTGSQLIQNMNSAVNQLSTTLTAQAQGFEATMKFAANEFNQIMGIVKSTFDAAKNITQAFVKNQKN